jgi:hypothetical protein
MKGKIMKSKQKLDMSQFPVSEIQTATENDSIYGRFSTDNYDDQQLVESIRKLGILDPLVISSDRILLSGHRRFSAAKRLGLKSVPVRMVSIAYLELPHGERLHILSEFNQQREKSSEERIHEAFVRADPEVAPFEIAYRAKAHRLELNAMPKLELGCGKRRHNIKASKFLEAASKVINENKKYWPLTVRRVHYLLLNNPPLKHDKKPDSVYKNDLKSYKTLTGLLTRARLTGQIRMDSIEDSTRPVLLGRGFDSVQQYIRQETDNFLIGYRRDLQQGQPNHIEIMLEKNALRTVIEEVADEYCIPITTARGYVSLPPKAGIADRFRRSGKKALVLLLLTDFDPDGEEIAKSTARSLRDDFGIKDIHAVKVALTAEDILEHNLPSDMDAKKTSTNYKKFIAEHGADRVVELDAAPVELLQSKLREAIEQHMDIDEYNKQLDIENEDNMHIYARRQVVFETLGASKT